MFNETACQWLKVPGDFLYTLCCVKLVSIVIALISVAVILFGAQACAVLRYVCFLIVLKLEMGILPVYVHKHPIILTYKKLYTAQLNFVIEKVIIVYEYGFIF